MKIIFGSSVLFALLLTGSTAYAQDQPNIVLVFMDNFGWGEPGFNGGGTTRGAATPRLDTLAAEGLRLTNFNIEVQCTPSRSAILTGRYDPGETYNVLFPHTWVAKAALVQLEEHVRSLARNPPIRPGTPEPYEP